MCMEEGVCVCGGGGAGGGGGSSFSSFIISGGFSVRFAPPVPPKRRIFHSGPPQ